MKKWDFLPFEFFLHNNLKNMKLVESLKYYIVQENV